MKQLRKALGLVLAVCVLMGAAAPALANDRLDLLADIHEETEYENRGRVSLIVGEQKSLRDSIRWKSFYDAEDDEVEWILHSVRWQSSYEPVATIDQNGMVTAHKVGTARITATGTDNRGQRRVQTVTVGVTGSANAVAASNSLELAEGHRIGLGALLNPDGSRSVTWSSSNNSIGRIDEAGELLADSIGVCTITAAWTDEAGNLREQSVSVRVVSSLLEYSTKSISLVMDKGQELDLAAFYYPNYESPWLRDYSAGSSSSEVASVQGLVVRAEEAGSCILSLYRQEGYEKALVQRISLTVRA